MKATKTILSVLIVLLVGATFGSDIASAAGINPVAFVGGTGVLGLLIGGSLNGALPMAINITSVYAGEVLDTLLVRATTANELVDGGHIHMEPNIQKKFTIPRLKVGKMLQKRKEQPTEEDSKGDFNVTEKYLEPQDVMAFTTFNPRSFEKFWRPFQPTGNLVFRELPPEAQNKMLAEMAKVVNFELGNEFINGVKGDAEGEYFDGILTRISADGDVLTVDTAAAITEVNIITALKAVVAKIPKALKKANVKPKVKLFMSVTNAEMYDYVLTEKPYKGMDYTGMNPERFKGYKIVPLADWPDDVIVAAYANTEMDSNFWAGVDYVDDAEVIQIDKLTNAGEKYFFKMLLKADTNIVFGEDIVLWDGRAV
ncbi:hypothetical protein [Maribellus mangrovi]|uniref:hypothetical protein n=1 Tax=Maribellus mangrovi TaxID=3133146 RepID=UPI0030EC485C